MRVGDLVTHCAHPRGFGIVLSFDEYRCHTIRWLTSDNPARKGMISKHHYRTLKLLSEAK